MTKKEQHTVQHKYMAVNKVVTMVAFDGYFYEAKNITGGKSQSKKEETNIRL